MMYGVKARSMTGPFHYETKLAVAASSGLAGVHIQYVAACVATPPLHMLMGLSHGVVVTCPAEEMMMWF